ncbi:MAG: heterodisulfide reductase-related iron-sulfur binding cluster [Candidatus Eremiobacteraeota bacterium]|nr:heterodisulfide reductase-related iron-sulfur binding cluster [Candidatus Eremiobacteraeota bacterium]
MIDASLYDRCVRCGLCLTSCPTYTETMTETSGPRGRISLMKAVAEGELSEDAPGYVAQMAECLGCRACEAACPSGVPYGELIEAARASLHERAVGNPALPPKRGGRELSLLLRAVERPSWLHAGARLLRFAQRSGAFALARRIGLLRALGLEEAARMAPPIDARFEIPDDTVLRAPVSRGRAFLHLGCIAQCSSTGIHRAAIKLLLLAGLDVVRPSDQRCCGALAAHAGERERARILARANIAAFERSGADVVAIDAAGCGAQCKGYGHLLADDPKWAARAKAFSERVRDISEILAACELPPPTRALAARVAYQEPCHLVHAQRITNAPKRLLAMIPEIELVALEEATLCCGGAGVYAIGEPEMSARLRERKADAIRRSGASVIASANIGCMLQLRDAIAPLQVRHVVELLADAYESEPAGAAQ